MQRKHTWSKEPSHPSTQSEHSAQRNSPAVAVWPYSISQLAALCKSASFCTAFFKREIDTLLESHAAASGAIRIVGKSKGYFP